MKGGSFRRSFYLADQRLMTLTFILGGNLHLFIKKNKLCKYSEKEVVITLRLSEFIEEVG